MPKAMPSPIDSLVGGRLKKERERQGRTLADVGNGANISPQMLFMYESGQSRIYLGVLVALARTLGCKTSHLIDGKRG